MKTAQAQLTNTQRIDTITARLEQIKEELGDMMEGEFLAGRDENGKILQDLYSEMISFRQTFKYRTRKI